MPSIGFEGILSSGKTALCVGEAIEQARTTGKRLLSNILIFDFEYEYLPNEDLISFLEENRENKEAIKAKFFNTVFIVDEIANLINARKSNSNLSELILNFFMMLGKLDCDVYYTYQIRESQVDKQFREISPIFVKCKRIDANGNLLIFEPRVVPYPVYVFCVITVQFSEDDIIEIQTIADPEPYYHYYDTREIVMLDRSKYLKK